MMSASPPTAPQLAQRLGLDGRPLAHALDLNLAGCRLRLESDSPGLVNGLRRYFSDFLAHGQAGPADIIVRAIESAAPELGLSLREKAPDPGKDKIKEEFLDLPDGGRVVRKRLTGMVFLLGDGLNLAVGPCQANDNQVVNFINSRHIQWLLDRGRLLCHAAAVANHAGGLAIAGLSGRGKSTLALHMMGLGLDFISNDRLLIGRDARGLRMEGVAKLPRINPGTVLGTPGLQGVIPPDDLAGFAALPPDELWRLEHKYDAYLDECFGPGRFRLGAPLDGLVVLTWRHGGGPFCLERVTAERKAQLLEAFIKSPGVFYLPPQGQGPDMSVAAYLAMLGDCPVHELSGGADFPAAAKALHGLLPPAIPRLAYQP